MRQVPKQINSPLGRCVGLVGDGRVSRHFQFYFKSLEIPFETWSRKTSLASPEIVFERCDPILLLISDSAIESFIQAHPALQKKTLVHCSGSLVSDLAIGWHPLMTFGPDLYDLPTYRQIPFIGEEGSPAFEAVFPSLPNSHYVISRELRPLYHSLCVMSGNFSTILWKKFFSELESKLNLPREVSFPYLKRITLNLISDAESALTGPLQRKDRRTIELNLNALQGDEFQKVYRAFAEATGNSI